MNLALDKILTSHLTHKPMIMGILNVTPDSFSDGNKFMSVDSAVNQAIDMLAAGADIIDIGAESTRPGASRISAKEQIARLEGIIPPIIKAGACVSIDTTLAEVAAYGLDAGAKIINDVSAGRDDPEMFPLVADRKAIIILMHMLGKPKTMQIKPVYHDVVTEVANFLTQRVDAATEAGIHRDKCIIDPGIGFGKTTARNLTIINSLSTLTKLNLPILVGLSRKRFIGELTDSQDQSQKVQNRLGGTIAACIDAYRQGATIFRVHDVLEVKQAINIAKSLDDHRKELNTEE